MLSFDQKKPVVTRAFCSVGSFRSWLCFFTYCLTISFKDFKGLIHVRKILWIGTETKTIWKFTSRQALGCFATKNKLHRKKFFVQWNVICSSYWPFICTSFDRHRMLSICYKSFITNWDILLGCLVDIDDQGKWHVIFLYFRFNFMQK